jgi:ubiquitin-activating enzyme E1
VSSLSAFRMVAVDFDKDVDAHMRVVAAVSNLRARNYRIPEADLHTSRGIAGKITPAIATTTALVTGAICIELYKIVQNKTTAQLVNSFTNLALPLFTSMEPEPPKATAALVKGQEWKWTQWDRVDVTDPDMTIDGLIAYLDEAYGVELSMLSTGVTILYSDFMDRKKMKERKTMPLRAVVELVTKKPIPAAQKYLIFEIIVTDSESGDEVEIPYLRFKLY